MLAVFEGQIDQAIELAREALYQLPADDHFFRNLAAWNLSGTLAISGDVEGGLKQLTEVIDNSLAAKNYLVAIIALCRQGMAQTQYGNLNQAKGLFEQALDIAKIYHKGLAPAASEALGGLGKIYWEWNQFEAAREYLEESIQLSKRWRASAVLDSYVTLAHLHQSQGEPQNASRIMDQAYQLAVEDTISKSDDNYVAYQKAHLCLRQGDLPAAQRWASSRQLGAYVDQDSIESTGQLSTDTILRFELIVLARILIAETRYAEANHLLDLIYPAIETWGYAARKIEIHMLKALGLRSLGDTDLAEISLESALDLAEVEGYLRIFTDEGDPVRKILKEAHSQSRRQDFINSLLPAFDPPREPDTHMALIEPLSEREIEILRLLKSELTAPEIAAQLHIAVSTMRTHTKNIYGKLGAHSRFEAVTKAEELGII
jgi:LuxR family maltose regulon positive regulatory protein